jgi:hypothetical protein
MRIPLLDLFSGIGGFSFALHDACQTIAYCEQDVNCQKVLLSNMVNQRIDKAPIHCNIETLHASNLPQFPTMVTAGFPCQDISKANLNGQGLLGTRSKLLEHVFRLIDECGPSVKIIYFENVSNILNNEHALRYIDTALKSRKFCYVHTSFSCDILGAPMKRKRWYCVAFRGEDGCNKLHQMQAKLSGVGCGTWNRAYTASKVIMQHNTTLPKLRCSMLGNSIVPACVLRALQLLTQHARTTGDRARMKYIATEEHTTCKKTWKITITDGSVTKTSKHWYTPSAQVKHWYACYSPWTRCSEMLSKQIFMELGTVKKYGIDAQKTHEVNPCFVEWLMGYPRNYTLVKKT